MNIKEFFMYKKGMPSDINNHLQFLYDITKLVNAQQVVELGVRDGGSTSAFLAALEETGGKLWSCDLNSPLGELGNINVDFWTMNVGHDLSKEIFDKIPETFDILFIDTSHDYLETVEELKLYFPRLKTGGLILMHDSNEPMFAGELKAIEEFLNVEPKCEFYNIQHDHGMGVIRKNKRFTTEMKGLLHEL